MPHTYAVPDTLKDHSIVPEWVQVGNKTNDGMRWPEGRASTHMASFAQLVDCGYAAVKAMNPTPKVIVRCSKGYDNRLFRYLFDGLTNNGPRFDVIGLSLHPSASDWPTRNAQCQTNSTDLAARATPTRK